MAITRKFQLRDVVNTTEEYGARTFVVVDFTSEGYRVLSLKDRKRYNITEDQIGEKVGQVQEDAAILQDADDEPADPDDQERYCELQARNFPSEAAKWRYLSKRRHGDTIKVVHRKTIFEAVFLRINQKKPLYPIRAKIKGLAHDFHLEALLAPKG
jgi:hypothetical protein